MSTKGFYLSSVAGFAALIAASSASATTVSYSLSNPIGSLGAYTTQTDILTTNSISNLLFPKFNNLTGIYAGATLNSVDVFLQLDYRANLVLTNLNASTTTGTAKTSISATLQLPNTTNNTVNDTQAGSFTLLPTIGATTTTGNLFGKYVTVTASFTPTFHLITSTIVGTIPFDTFTTDATDLAAFTGAAGTFESSKYTTVTSTLLSFSGGNASSTQVTQTDVVGIVTYDFTAAPPPTPPGPVGVPEPMTGLLLAGGLAGLAAVRRRR